MFVGVSEFLYWNSGCNRRVLVEKLMCIVCKCAKVVLDWFVAAVDGGIECRVLNINPKFLSVNDCVIDVCIVRQSESVWVLGELCHGVCCIGNGNAEVTNWFWYSSALARHK